MIWLILYTPEVLSCRRAIEFATDCGFSDLVVEVDNTSVIKALRTNCSLPSRLGHIFQDVSCLIHGLRWVERNCVKRSANTVAHSLARYARTVSPQHNKRIPMRTLRLRCG